MFAEDLSAIVQSLRKDCIASAGELVPGQNSVAEVESLIPHRPPFRLVDGIEAYDLARRIIVGHCSVEGSDPVFAGHFPGHPVYPGVLQVEAISQLGLCLFGLGSRSRGKPADARALKIHHALFLAEVRPGARLRLMARILEEDSLTATVAGQVYVDGTLCSLAVVEAYLVDA